MPLYHYVTIDGQDVSPWLLQADIDMVLPNSTDENWVQQADVTLSNVNDRFSSSFGGFGFGPLSSIVIVLISMEWGKSLDDVNVYSTIAFAGLCQNVNDGYTTVKIHASTEDTQCSGYLGYDIHFHKGVTSEPPIYEVTDMYSGQKIGELIIPPIRKREMVFLEDHSGKGVLDVLANHDGSETFKNETNQLMYTTPHVISTAYPPFTGRMKLPMQSESAIGLCNKVEVRGGSWADPSTPASSFENHDAIVYITTPADLALLLNDENNEGGEEKQVDMMANFGEIKAPIYRFPDLSTIGQCREKALHLLARYISYYKRSLPGVIGRSPWLQSKVSWQYERWTGARWELSPEFKGRVVRCKTNYGPTSGWMALIEVQPYVINPETAAEIYQGMSQLPSEEQST